MKISRNILVAIGALTVATTSGCILLPDFGDSVGTVEFSYVLLLPDANGDVVAAASCEEIGVDEIRVLFGSDFNGDGILDDNEVQDEAIDFCNQLDFDGDGNILQDEFGLFSGPIFSGFYDLFAVEFRNAAGATLGWQTFDVNQDFARFSFGGGISISANTINIIPFSGDQFQTPSEELQAFFGF
jgi:hypothetical protein